MEAIVALFGGMFALLISATIVLSVFWIWMLIECINNEEIKGTEKAFFLLLIIFLHWIGGAIYCFSVNRKERFGCFPIMVIIVASFIFIIFMVGLIKSINENKHPKLIRAREIINEFVDRNILFINPDKTIQENDIESENITTESTKQQSYSIDQQNIKLPNQNTTNKKNEKYLLLNKSDENRRPAQTPKEIANINTSKYSEKLNSWIDSNGKVHFTNTDMQQAPK